MDGKTTQYSQKIWLSLGYIDFIFGFLIGDWYYGFQTENTLDENLRDTFENWQSEFLQI